MGMDVHGRNPRSDQGRYFRANIFSWPSILDAIAATNVLPRELVQEMAFNDGKGPGKKDAIKLANALEKLMEDNVVIMPSSAGEQTASFARTVCNALGGLGGNTNLQTQDGFYVEPEHMKEFITFCRESGGFKVW